MSDKRVNVLVYSGMLIRSIYLGLSKAHNYQEMVPPWSLFATASGRFAACCPLITLSSQSREKLYSANHGMHHARFWLCQVVQIWATAGL